MGDSECYIGYGIFQAGNEIFFQDDIDMKCYNRDLEFTILYDIIWISNQKPYK